MSPFLLKLSRLAGAAVVMFTLAGTAHVFAASHSGGCNAGAERTTTACCCRL